MASDGDLNVGISSEDELNAFVSEKRGQGTYLSVLGFGSGNYQDAKMETLADYGNGSYHTSIPPTRQPASTSVFWPSGRFLWPTM